MYQVREEFFAGMGGETVYIVTNCAISAKTHDLVYGQLEDKPTRRQPTRRTWYNDVLAHAEM